jgi:REP-associated tyrosine transposase
MMPIDPDRRHRRSIRLRGYDYAQAGAYFVTICARQHQSLFDDETLRQIAEECWLAIPNFNPGVELDEWVVMPNHLHGIVVFVGEQGAGEEGGFSNTPTAAGVGKPGVLSNTPTGAARTIDAGGRDVANRFSVMSPQRGTLGLVIRKYKAAVTGKCRGIDRFDFAWQSNYFEHIIRDEHELDVIRRYIASNPANWDLDRDNIANSEQRPPSEAVDDYLRDAGL